MDRISFQEIKKNLKNTIDFYLHKRKLKKLGLTDKQYKKLFDENINNNASHLKLYFKGYPYLRIYKSTIEEPFNNPNNWETKYNEMCQWCDKNCKNKWRDDFLPIEKKIFDWEIVPLGNDCLIFAFKDDKDYLHFLLRWG